MDFFIQIKQGREANPTSWLPTQGMEPSQSGCPKGLYQAIFSGVNLEEPRRQKDRHSHPYHKIFMKTLRSPSPSETKWVRKKGAQQT